MKTLGSSVPVFTGFYPQIPVLYRYRTGTGTGTELGIFGIGTHF
ncbi:hypothetical protein HanOQP8_Chr14g0540141 [Helianthus annuus]|nr:hypothetical protein HanOQP8_Chr14g0540141 [Helianthus annuus]